VKKKLFVSGKFSIFSLGKKKKNKNTKKTCVLGVFSNYYSSTSTTPRNTKQVSFERGNRVLEHQGEFFQFRIWGFEIFRDFEKFTKNIAIFHFFTIIKIVILDINQKSKKTLLCVVEHTFTFRMIPVLFPQAV